MLLLFHNYLQQTIETANTYLEKGRRGVTEILHCPHSTDNCRAKHVLAHKTHQLTKTE